MLSSINQRRREYIRKVCRFHSICELFHVTSWRKLYFLTIRTLYLESHSSPFIKRSIDTITLELNRSSHQIPISDSCDRIELTRKSSMPWIITTSMKHTIGVVVVFLLHDRIKSSCQLSDLRKGLSIII